jgi:hypothetical protein
LDPQKKKSSKLMSIKKEVSRNSHVFFADHDKVDNICRDLHIPAKFGSNLPISLKETHVG